MRLTVNQGQGSGCACEVKIASVSSKLPARRDIKQNKTGNYRLTYQHEKRSLLEYQK